jgi:type I restriction enzyme S subunit
MSAATKNLNGYGTVPGHWEVAALPDAVFFQEGPGLRKWQWTDSGMKVINVTNILGDGRIDTNNTSRFISIEEYKKTYRHFTVDVGDIVIASSGNTYGKVGRISAKDLPLMMNTSVIRLRSSDRKRLNDEFLYAFVRSEVFRNQVEAFVIGSAQPNFGPTHLKRMVMPLPPLPDQKRIAGILSAYDELIENSQRRIKILESMARALYREWFVHYRFPGHEKHPLVASPLGEIPLGWEVKKLGDVVELNYGKALKKEDRRDGDYPVFGSSGIVGSHDGALVKGPGIIVGRKGNVGSVFWCNEDFFVIDTAYFVTSILPLRFLFYVLPTLNFINSDAAVPGLSRNQAYTLEILVPPAPLLEKFCELAGTFERQAATLQRQTQNLRRTRDLLLPRLLSGQIEVS